MTHYLWIGDSNTYIELDCRNIYQSQIARHYYSRTHNCMIAELTDDETVQMRSLDPRPIEFVIPVELYQFLPLPISGYDRRYGRMTVELYFDELQPRDVDVLIRIHRAKLKVDFRVTFSSCHAGAGWAGWSRESREDLLALREHFPDGVIAKLLDF